MTAAPRAHVAHRRRRGDHARAGESRGAYPEREHQRKEARERTVGTALGAGVAAIVVFLYALQPREAMLAGLLFLGGLWFAGRMMDGPLSANTYLLSYSVIVVLVVGSLAAGNPFEAWLDRLLLTMGGAAAALGLLALLESVLLPRRAPLSDPHPSTPPQELPGSR